MLTHDIKKFLEDLPTSPSLPFLDALSSTNVHSAAMTQDTSMPTGTSNDTSNSMIANAGSDVMQLHHDVEEEAEHCTSPLASDMLLGIGRKFE